MSFLFTGKERDGETGLDYFGDSVYVVGAGAFYERLMSEGTQ
jgi:hypothetical protein